MAELKPIPERVYWAPLSDNFYSAEGQGMGLEFYRTWKPRRAEFPQGESAGWGPDSAHNPFKDKPRVAAPVPAAGAEQKPAMSLERKQLIARQIVGDDPQSQVTALRIINAVLFDLGAFASEAGGHATDIAAIRLTLMTGLAHNPAIDALNRIEQSLVHLAAPQTSGPTGGPSSVAVRLRAALNYP